MPTPANTHALRWDTSQGSPVSGYAGWGGHCQGLSPIPQEQSWRAGSKRSLLLPGAPNHHRKPILRAADGQSSRSAGALRQAPKLPDSPGLCPPSRGPCPLPRPAVSLFSLLCHPEDQAHSSPCCQEWKTMYFYQILFLSLLSAHWLLGQSLPLSGTATASPAPRRSCPSFLFL